MRMKMDILSKVVCMVLTKLNGERSTWMGAIYEGLLVCMVEITTLLDCLKFMNI